MADANDLIIQSFTRGFEAAQALYLADKQEDCAAACQALLNEPSIPHYHRIRTLCILADVVDDWHDACTYLEEAKILYRWVKRFHPRGKAPDMDKTMDQLADLLHSSEQVLEEEAPDDAELNKPDREAAIDAELDRRLLAKQTAEEEEEELERIDAQVLGMSVEEMRAKTASKAASKNNKPREPRTPKLIGKLISGTTSVAASPATAAFAASTPVTAQEFLFPGTHEPLPGRARSLRKKNTHTGRKSVNTNTLPSRSKPGLGTPADGTTNDTRPPAVLPKFAIELFGVPDSDK